MNHRVGKTRARRALFVLGLLIAAAHSASAAELGDALGGEAATGTMTGTAPFQVNGDADASIAVSRIARDADGNFVIVWQQEQMIQAQRYDFNGQRVGDSFRVDDDQGAARQPAVAMEPGGAFAIVWQRGGDIYLRRYGADGAALADAQGVNAATDGEQSAPSVALYQEIGNANQNDAIVVWQSATGAGSDIFARTFDGTGQPRQASDVAVNQITDGDQVEPSVGVATSGRFVVAWAGPATNDTQGILARRFDAMATALGVEFQVNSTGPGVQRQPSVAVSANGVSVVAWRSRNEGATDIRVQRFDDDGVPVGDEQTVSGIDVAVDAAPRIALAATERAGLVWSNQGGDVVARLFDGDGAPEGELFTLASGLDEPGILPDIGVDADGDFAVTWHDDDTVLANRYVGAEPVDLNFAIQARQSAVLVGDSTDYQLIVANFHDVATGATDILDINNAIGASQGVRFVIDVPDALTVQDIDSENISCETEDGSVECRSRMLLRAGASITPNVAVTVSPSEAGLFQATGRVTENQIDPNAGNDDDAERILAEASREGNAGTGGSGDGGGCTLARGDRPVDPMLWLLALSAFVLVRRRRRCLRR